LGSFQKLAGGGGHILWRKNATYLNNIMYNPQKVTQTIALQNEYIAEMMQTNC